MRWAFTLLLAVGCVGCAQNAILEIEMTLPPADQVGGMTRAVIGFQLSGAATPATVTPDQQEFLLPPAGDSVQRLSIVASGGDVELPLWLSVRYCDTECGFGEAPRLIRYERAFYVGEFTQHELTLPLPTDEDVAVGTCEVFGCLGDTMPTSGACVYGEGRHACEGPL